MSHFLILELVFFLCFFSKGVIVVVDSVNFPNEKREVAHVIISALSEPTVQNRRVPVLIACNKQGMRELREYIMCSVSSVCGVCGLKFLVINYVKKMLHIVCNCVSDSFVDNLVFMYVFTVVSSDVALALPETDIQPALEDEMYGQ